MPLACKGDQNILLETDGQRSKRYKLSKSGKYWTKMKRMMGKSGGRGLPEPVSQVLTDEKAIWEDHIVNQVVKLGGQQEQSPKGELGLMCLKHRSSGTGKTK